MERLLLIAILLQVCAAGTNLDSHFKTTIEERIDFISGRISVRNGGPDGTWKKSVWCPIDSFANGYAMKIQPDSGSSDDASLNNIALFCSDRAGSQKDVIVSSQPGVGSWTQSWKCSGKDTFFTMFSLQVEIPQGSGDDTAANYVKFKCRPFSGELSQVKTLETGSGLYGSWDSFSNQCPQDSVICGMSARVQPYGDDESGINDVRFHCCGKRNCS